MTISWSTCADITDSFEVLDLLDLVDLGLPNTLDSSISVLSSTGNAQPRVQLTSYATSVNLGSQFWETLQCPHQRRMVRA
jgi:hypothetical protein